MDELQGKDTPTQSIPRIGTTEDVQTNQKIIHQRWTVPQTGFFWLIAEIDPDDRMAFGYANLNDDMNAEWGYISLEEIAQCGAYSDPSWKPTTFGDCTKSAT